MKRGKFTLSETELKNMIKRMVKESIETIGDNSQFEVKSKEEKSKDNVDDRLSDMNRETDKQSVQRNSIENFFKQPGVNNAPYAYSLYGVDAKKGEDTNDMKNARKKFADCVNHAENEYGYPYSFSSAQLNRLKGMISGNELSEAVNNALKKVLKENNIDVEYKKSMIEQKEILEKLLVILKRHGIQTADLTSHPSGEPVISISSDEWSNSNASEIARKFAESKGMYVNDKWYPATTYVNLEKN